MELAQARPRKTITPRMPKFVFDHVPKYWIFESPLASAIVNGVNLLFPAGERFFIRSVQHYMNQITDEELKAQIKGFFGQEGRHAGAHEKYFDRLRQHGFDIDGLLKTYEHLAFDIIEKASPPVLRLSVTVALEHFTAIMAERAFEDRILDFADPAMRDLLYWHASEEIEHKAVAFDVLKQVDPRYSIRFAGMILASTLLAGFWTWATLRLLSDDKEFAQKSSASDVKRIAAERVNFIHKVFVGGILDYLRPSFHPNDKDTSKLAETYLAAAGLA